MWLACLLFAAQLLSQFHVLQHLENLDHDEAQNEVCLLCIIGAAIDLASVNSATLAFASTDGTESFYAAGQGFTTRSLIAYRGRAPPSSSSIA